jgi:hypothetical protein
MTLELGIVELVPLAVKNHSRRAVEIGKVGALQPIRRPYRTVNGQTRNKEQKDYRFAARRREYTAS